MPNIALTRLLVIATCLSSFAVFGASAEDGVRASSAEGSRNEAPGAVATVERVTVQSEGRLVIPDVGEAAVTGAVEVHGLRDYQRSVMLRLSLHHPRPSDLEIVLRNPAGTEVVVWNRNRAMPDPVLDFPVEGFMPNDPVNGTWTVSVTDHARGAMGTLDSWVLTVQSHD